MKGDDGSTTKIIALSKLIGRHNGRFRSVDERCGSRFPMKNVCTLFSRFWGRKSQIFSKRTRVTLELFSSFLISHRFLIADIGKKKEIKVTNRIIFDGGIFPRFLESLYYIFGEMCIFKFYLGNCFLDTNVYRTNIWMEWKVKFHRSKMKLMI